MGEKCLEQYNETIRVSVRSAQMTAVFDEAARIAREIGVGLRIWSEDYYSEKNKYPWPWKRTFIAANGDVVPCCILADSDTIKMGNVFDQSFAEIWNSAWYRELRRRIRTH